MDPLIEEEGMTESWTIFDPVSYVLQFLAQYGWFVVGALGAALYVLHRLRPRINAYKQAREDAEYHKDPDKALARMEAVQRARERQHQLLLQASQRALEQQREREERKRAEAAERLRKYGAAAGAAGAGGAGGGRLGTGGDDFLPLSGGASTSTYRPPKKSACSKGGCGR